MFVFVFQERIAPIYRVVNILNTNQSGNECKISNKNCYPWVSLKVTRRKLIFLLISVLMLVAVAGTAMYLLGWKIV
jgi:hypothetical protein